jgi:hypothetical protein
MPIMSISKFALVLLTGTVALTLLTGCPQQTCNQYACSDPVTAGAKVTSDQLDSLNEADIQVLATVAKQAAAAAGQDTSQIPDITAAQAHGLVVFLEDNNIKTAADIEALFNRLQTNPSSVTVSQETIDAIESLNLGSIQGT